MFVSASFADNDAHRHAVKCALSSRGRIVLFSAPSSVCRKAAEGQLEDAAQHPQCPLRTGLICAAQCRTGEQIRRGMQRIRRDDQCKCREKQRRDSASAQCIDHADADCCDRPFCRMQERILQQILPDGRAAEPGVRQQILQCCAAVLHRDTDIAHGKQQHRNAEAIARCKRQLCRAEREQPAAHRPQQIGRAARVLLHENRYREQQHTAERDEVKPLA